jgi:hypothetical protein
VDLLWIGVDLLWIGVDLLWIGVDLLWIGVDLCGSGSGVDLCGSGSGVDPGPVRSGFLWIRVLGEFCGWAFCRFGVSFSTSFLRPFFRREIGLKAHARLTKMRFDPL